jgi:hypothetical protein
MNTIRENPHLFPIVCRINVDRFQSLLISHPNQPFVKSVCDGLREGFWPWADTRLGDYPLTHDQSSRPLKSDKERDFIRAQRDDEISKGRFSQSFGTELLPGMYSMPIHAVPKPHSENLRLISAGKFSLNSMIIWPDVGKTKLDTLTDLFNSILEFRRVPGNESASLILFKSDVSEAFRQMPVHPLWQLKQINTIDGLRHVDHNCAFGNRGCPKIWTSFMGLVMWIAIFIFQILAMKDYMDDAYSFELEGAVTWYDGYGCFLPTKQAKLLTLWDLINLPHKREKQESGRTLTIIGFEVDANAMSITMPPQAKSDLIGYLEDFLKGSLKGRRHELREFQRLAGWVNWSLNVFPLLKPGLSNCYAKMTGKVRPKAQLYVGKRMCEDLMWLIRHLRAAPGVFVYKTLTWEPADADLTIYCDASSDGLGIFIPSMRLALRSGIPCQPPSDHIFFFEALTVCSALHWAASSDSFIRRLAIFTDNSNTVDIYSSLRASHIYNVILKSSVDILIQHDIDLKVSHIPGELNVVADAISRSQFRQAHSLVPGLRILSFQPPRDALGAILQ